MNSFALARAATDFLCCHGVHAAFEEGFFEQRALACLEQHDGRKPPVIDKRSRAATLPCGLSVQNLK
jgi:hypothetical protein